MTRFRVIFTKSPNTLLTITVNLHHGSNKVKETGDTSPPLFSDVGNIIYHLLPHFYVYVLYYERFHKQKVVGHEVAAMSTDQDWTGLHQD